MNDSQRDTFVVNDEGLYNLLTASGLSRKKFVRENRKLIDDCMEAVRTGKKRQHFLAYDPPEYETSF